MPATEIARGAIRALLVERRRKALHDAITAYAKVAAGSQDDIDADLEAAGIELLTSQGGGQ